MFAKFACAFLALLAIPVYAADTTPTEGDLEAIQARTMILKAQLDQAKVVKDLAATGAAKAASDSAAANAGEDPVGTPVVKDVFASGNSLAAHFIYPDGTSFPASAGQSLPGGCKVVSIELGAVQIRCHGVTKPIGFSRAAPQQQPKQSQSPPGSFGASFMPMPGPVSAPPSN